MPAVKYKLLIAVLFSLFAWMVPGQDAPAQDTAVATTSATELFGIMADGARFVYVFDVSGSTEGAPLRAARHELQASIERLQRIHQFQIVFYNHTPQVLSVRGQSPRLYWADEQNKRFARRFIQQVKAGGGTNHLDALRMALNMQPDVIFFYTDAESPQMDEDQLLKVRQLNGSAKIHAIEFGRGEKLAGENFLTQLAHENSGEYRYVDVNRWRRETNDE
jgi:hypothetical protein